MMTISQIKSFARRQLKGNWLSAVGVVLLTLICFTIWTIAATLVMVIGILGPLTGRIRLFDIGSDPTVRMLFFSGVGIVIAALIFIGLYLATGFMLGTQKFYLDMAKGKKVDAFSIFKGFSDTAHLKRYFGVVVILYALELIMMIPLGVIGVRYGVKSMDYRITNRITSIVVFVVMLFFNMSTFASADNRELKAIDAIKVSLRLMRCRKLKFVLLELSFILWFLLIAISCGLASFLIIPYFNESLSVFYLSAYGEEFQTKTKEASADRPDTDTPDKYGKDGDGQSLQNEEASEPKDLYVKGDAVPENEPARSFEEVRRQYTGDDGMGARYKAAEEAAEGAGTAASESLPEKTGNSTTEKHSTEDDAFSAYEQWKKDHGITMENRDPFHGKYKDQDSEKKEES